jgi:hypothetical protein
MRMDNERIISRYTHLYPTVDRKALEVQPHLLGAPSEKVRMALITIFDTLQELLAYKPSFFRWSGADLFNVTEAKGYLATP